MVTHHTALLHASTVALIALIMGITCKQNQKDARGRKKEWERRREREKETSKDEKRQRTNGRFCGVRC